jgi:hypothetical protein
MAVGMAHNKLQDTRRRLWGDHGSYSNFLQNRRPGIHPGIVDVYFLARDADRKIAEIEEEVRRMERMVGLPEGRTEAAPEVPPMLMAALLLVARVVMLVVFNVVWFAFLIWLLVTLV